MSSAARRIAADFLREEMQMDGIKSSELSKIFENEPPTLTTFLSDSQYLNHMRPTLPSVDEAGYEFVLSPIQYDFVRNFEQIFRPELYIAMVEEFGDYWSPLPMKHMFVANWGKSCLVAGETVFNSKTGQWVKVEELKESHSVLAVNPDTEELSESNASSSWEHGRGNCVEVTTQTGAKTRVYEGHRFLTKEGWKHTRDLKVGDSIANAVTLPVSDPVRLPESDVELLGFWLGDGCVSNKRSGMSMYFNSYEESAISRYVELLEGLGYTPTVTQTNGSSGVKVTAGTNRTICSNGHEMNDGNSYVLKSGKSRCRTCRRLANVRAARKALGSDVPAVQAGRREGALSSIARQYGLLGKKAHTKTIPDEIFSLPEDQIELFLSRLWGTDGWVESDRLAYTTVSEELAKGIFRLLKRLGIRSVVRKRNTSWTHKGERKTSHAWNVVIATGLDILTFNRRVVLLDKWEKQDLLSSKVQPPRVSTRDIVWDSIKSIESIGVHTYYDLSVPGLENYVGTDGLIGHNSGKDTTVRVGFVRIASLLNHMVSPQSYFNMAAFDSIQMLNVAATAQQARDAFFEPMKKLFKSNAHLSSLFYGDDPAEGAHRIKLKKNIDIISGNSIAENQEGLNLIAACADEISAFKVAEEFKQTGDGRAARGAAQIVGMLRSSSSTRFPKTYKVAQISWPRFAGDAIEKAVAQGNKSIKELGDSSAWFVSGPHATWDVKPNATKADFQAHYDEDPEQADAMYACKPPKSTNIFIRDEVTIDAAFEKVQEEPVQVDYYWGPPPAKDIQNAPEGAVVQDGWQVKFTFAPSLKPKVGALYCLHGDMAIKGDRAGIAMSHVKSYRGDGEDERPMYKNDFTFTFESDLKVSPPREVQIRWYRQLIWELIERGFEIDTVTFDQFQSFDMMQTLEMYGIGSGLLSLDRNDKVYQNFKDIILDGRLEAYRPDPHIDSLVMSEIKRLRRSGRKIDHPPAFSKDAADALAGSIFNAREAGGEEDGYDLLDIDQSEDGENEWASDEMSLIFAGSGSGSGMDGLFGSGSPRPNPFAGTGYFK